MAKTDSQPKITFHLTHAEAKHLHAEIGDIPQTRVGPKVWELYRRLDAALALDWTKQSRKAKARA